MGESILATIKKMLGLEADYTPYDTDIIILINSAFMTLNQLGVGPQEGFAIKDYSSKWDDFVTNNVMINSVQEYVYMKTKMVFDPPQNSYVMDAMKDRCKEYEVRMNMQAESVEHFSFVNEENNPRL
jgi:hypothetical protein